MAYYPNGDIQSQTDTVNGTWSYEYDDANRLKCATESAGSHVGTTQWTYDEYGNRWQQGPASNCTAAISGGQSFTYTAATNRIDGYCYDAAGNLLDEGACPASGKHQFSYDEEGRLASSAYGATVYVYNPDGLRVAKQTAAGVSTVEYVYNTAASQVAAITPAGAWERGEVYMGGRHIATYFNGTTYFDQADLIGSERVRTNVSGATVETCANLSFGDGQVCAGTDVSPMHFTGKERDSESGNDSFGARYFGSSMGRFLSPDPWLGSIHLSNPQSLNRYTYVFNNPLRFVDPDGLDCIYLNAAGNGVDGPNGVDHNSNIYECLGTDANGRINGSNGGYWVNGNVNANDVSANADTGAVAVGNAEVFSWQNGEVRGAEFGQSIRVDGLSPQQPETQSSIVNVQLDPNAPPPPRLWVQAATPRKPVPPPGGLGCLLAPEAAMEIHDIAKRVNSEPSDEPFSADALPEGVYLSINPRHGWRQYGNNSGLQKFNSAAIVLGYVLSATGCALSK